MGLKSFIATVIEERDSQSFQKLEPFGCDSILLRALNPKSCLPLLSFDYEYIFE
jgi:hypothetical protein